MKYLTQAEAQSLDDQLFRSFSLEQLMELAGLSCAQAIIENFPSFQRFLVVCGPGNNGGDGLVIARQLVQLGQKSVSVAYPKANTKNPHFQRLVEQCVLLGIPVESTLPGNFDAIVDAVFGFSFQGPLRESFGSVIDFIKSSNVPIISIDIPSGWQVDNPDQDFNSLIPYCLISLSCPKVCAKSPLVQRHVLAGNFIPSKLQSSMDLPTFPKGKMFVKL